MHRSAIHAKTNSKLPFFYFFLQGVLVFLAAKSGFIKDADEAAQFQNFIICVEMLIAAVGHLFAFPYKEYAGANIGASRGLTGSLAHALKLNDFYHDTVHQVSLTSCCYFPNVPYSTILLLFWVGYDVSVYWFYSSPQHIMIMYCITIMMVMREQESIGQGLLCQLDKRWML